MRLVVTRPDGQALAVKTSPKTLLAQMADLAPFVPPDATWQVRDGSDLRAEREDAEA